MFPLFRRITCRRQRLMIFLEMMEMKMIVIRGEEIGNLSRRIHWITRLIFRFNRSWLLRNSIILLKNVICRWCLHCRKRSKNKWSRKLKGKDKQEVKKTRRVTIKQLRTHMLWLNSLHLISSKFLFLINTSKKEGNQQKV